jgi:nucleolin
MSTSDAALVQLLSSHGLSSYLGPLVRDGWETIDDVRALSEEELVGDIGMKKGHARRLVKAIEATRFAKTNASAPAPAPAPVKRPAESKKENKVSKKTKIEVPPVKEDSDSDESSEEESSEEDEDAEESSDEDEEEEDSDDDEDEEDEEDEKPAPPAPAPAVSGTLTSKEKRLAKRAAQRAAAAPQSGAAPPAAPPAPASVPAPVPPASSGTLTSKEKRLAKRAAQRAAADAEQSKVAQPEAMEVEAGTAEPGKLLTSKEKRLARRAAQRAGVAPPAEAAVSTGEVDPTATVFVGNLDWSVKDEDGFGAELRSHFADCGTILSIRWGMDRKTEKFAGYCHVKFADWDSADKAVKLAGSELCAREIKVDHAAAPGKVAGNGKIWSRPSAPVANPTDEIRCFVGNLDFTLKEQHLLAQEFEKIGLEIADAYFLTDKASGKFYGTSFVNFSSPQDAAFAVACHGQMLMGRPVRVEFSPYKKKEASGGQWGSGGKGAGGALGGGGGGKGGSSDWGGGGGSWAGGGAW